MSTPQSRAVTEPGAADVARPASSYDALPYPCDALPQTHPERLQIAAMLQGMTPAKADHCRVLELGCGDGANLLPMAELLPRSRFVGIDLSKRQIADGQSMIAELGLGNLELRCADLSKLDDSLGSFDYIICHGLYSWVPKPVQKSILALCARHLSAQGIAYISYNTFPGFHKQLACREMMRYHTAAIQDPVEAAKQGLALLDFLFQNTADKNSTDAQLLREELERLRELPLSYLFHEHLEADNHPIYFHQFMAEATAHGLQFLAEADKSGVELLPATAQQSMSALRSDVIRREQYLDYLRNSTLRSTLLCRASIELCREVDSRKLQHLQARGDRGPKSELHDVRAPDEVAFSTRFGSVKVDHPTVKSLGLLLHRARPEARSSAELTAQISALLDEPLPQDAVCEMVLHAYRIGFLTLHTQKRQLAAKVSERPLATPLTRLQARRQARVSNLWHEPVLLDALERRILQKLDGNHDSQALLADLIAAGVAPEKAAPRLSQILERFYLFALLTA